MKKGLIGIFAILVLMVGTMSVMAYDPDGTVWTANSGIGADDVVSLYGVSDFSYVKGRINARMVNTRGLQTAGSMSITAIGTDKVRQIVNVKWGSKDAKITSDTTTQTVLSVKATVSKNGQRTYGVPATVRYYKNTGNIDVDVANININQIEPTEQCTYVTNFLKICRAI